MKLASAHQLSLLDSTLVAPLPILTEAGEAPRWSFNYDNYQQDPAPDILVLGAYRHPNTGNNLVGGINLNYLDKTQRDDLARVLPQLMQQSNLYQRYHLGKRLLPGVFDNSYRTYNATHIRGINKGVFHPKYGMMRATTDFLKKKIGGLFKSKAQRAKDAEPKFPQDLSGMQDALDQAVNNLGLQVAKGEEEPDTPEMAAARQNFMQFKLDRAKSMADVEHDEDEPLIQATQNFQTTQLQHGKATPQQVGPYAAQEVQQYQSVPTPPATETTPQQMGGAIEQERLENQRELADPNNSLDLNNNGIPDDQEPPPLDPKGYNEAIVYFHPKLGRYIMEDLGEAIKEHLLTEWEGEPSLATKWREEMRQRRYINPDDLMDGNDFEWTFIYTDEGNLYTKPGQDEHSSHVNVIGENPELQQRYRELCQASTLSRMRMRAEGYDLLGRIGHIEIGPFDRLQIISFWGENTEVFERLLKPCLQALKPYLPPGSENSTFVCSNIYGNVPLIDLIGDKKPAQRDDREDMELYRQLHLMRGQEKQDAMKKLGVGGGGKPHPVASAMAGAGILKPGQKWWAPTSESILREPHSDHS